jgi:hypothetical protein
VVPIARKRVNRRPVRRLSHWTFFNLLFIMDLKVKRVLLALLILSVLAAAALFLLRDSKDPQRDLALIMSAKGDVRLLRPGADWTEGAAGRSLKSGTKIFTGNDSNVHLKLESGADLELELGSLAVLKDGEIELEYGRVNLKYKGGVKAVLGKEPVSLSGEGRVTLLSRRDHAEVRILDGDHSLGYKDEDFRFKNDWLVIEKGKARKLPPGDSSNLQILFPASGEAVKFDEDNKQIIVEWRGVQGKNVRLQLFDLDGAAEVDRFEGEARERWVLELPRPGRYQLKLSESTEVESVERATQVEFLVTPPRKD